MECLGVLMSDIVLSREAAISLGDWPSLYVQLQQILVRRYDLEYQGQLCCRASTHAVQPHLLLSCPFSYSDWRIVRDSEHFSHGVCGGQDSVDGPGR